MSLFDVFERTDRNYALYSESPYGYLNRSAQLPESRMRTALDEWFSAYPSEHQHELERRFQSKNPWAYESAFYELALHAMLRRLGCALEVHPDIPGTSTHPEFLVKPGVGSNFILEAVLAGGQTEQEIAAEKLYATIYDVLNRRIRSHGFFFSAHIHGVPKQQPSAKRIAVFVQTQLAALDPDKIAADYHRLGQVSLPRWPYPIDDDCSLEFEPISRKPEVRDMPNDRPLGVISFDGRFVDDVTPIREAVLRKADHYGDVTQPFVVAVNLMSATVHTDHIIKALNGTDGIWQSRRAKQISAILFTKWLMPVSVPCTEVHLFHNPSANHAYASVLTALPQAFTRTGGTDYVDGRSLADVFGLASDWPRHSTDQEDE
jgi:hypothetical protein